MTKQLFVNAWLVCVVAACGSVSKTQPDANGNEVDAIVVAPGDFALTVDTTSLSSAITGAPLVNITVVRDAALTDAIALTATGLPAGVTANFGAASLPSGSDTTTVTLTIDFAASAGTTDITITGTAGSKTHSKTVSLELHTQTVTGKVRSAAAGETVRLVGKSATLTDATGAFTFTDVKVPYDIYVLGQGGPENAPIPSVSYYKGLTRLDPVITKTYPYCVSGCFFVGLNNRSSTIGGSRSGAGTNAGPTYLKFTTTDGSEVNSSGTWSFTAGWFQVSGTTTSGKLQGLQATRGALNAPTGWLFAESANVTLTSGNSSNINLTLAALGTTAALTGTITQPGGFPTPTIVLSQQLSGQIFEVWTAQTTNGASTIPLLTNQKASFYVSTPATIGSNGLTEGVMPGLSASTDISMTLPPPAGLTGPVDGATLVTNATPFNFSTSANQVYQVSMNSNTAIYVIYTTSGSLTIPMIEEMALPSNKGFSWVIDGYGPLPDINSAADTVYLSGVSKFEGGGTFHTHTTSPTRDFQTQ